MRSFVSQKFGEARQSPRPAWAKSEQWLLPGVDRPPEAMLFTGRGVHPCTLTRGEYLERTA